MKKRSSLFLISLLLFGACQNDEQKKIEEIPPKEVTLIRPETKIISDSYTTDGILVPWDKINHTIDAEGIVKTIYRQNGDLVKKGETIVQFTDTKTESNYYQSKAILESAKSSLEVAKNNFDKYKKLYAREMVSQLDFLDYQRRYTDAEGDYLSAQAIFSDAEEKFKKLTRTSDTTGTLGNLFLKVGNITEYNETLFTVVDENEMEVTVDFPGKWYTSINPGGKATIKVADLDNREFEGFIEEINPVAGRDSKKFAVKLSFPNQEKIMKDGMYGKVTIPAGTREGFIVPQKAVFIRDMSSYIFVDEGGVAKKIPIERGALSKDHIEISSSELSSDTLLVLEGISDLEDGDKIKGGDR